MVDMVFPLSGRALPHDHAELLHRVMLEAAPWLASEPQAGIHPVKLAHGSGQQGLLSGRSRLLLRLPRQRQGDAEALAGRTLDMAGHAVGLGTPHARELLPHSTLYAYSVASTSDDEATFARWVDEALKALDLRSPWICGKRNERAFSGQMIPTFSVMVHNLPPGDALRLLEAGLGEHRLLGCGLFVPHKTTAAVGD